MGENIFKEAIENEMREEIAEDLRAARGGTPESAPECAEGVTWNGLNAKGMASVLDYFFYDLNALDNDVWNELFKMHGSPYRVGYNGGVYAEARTDRDRVALAKNHVLKAIDELEDLDACASISGIVGILENAEDALSDEIRERG